jgi:hypothetical protein
MVFKLLLFKDAVTNPQPYSKSTLGYGDDKVKYGSNW